MTFLCGIALVQIYSKNKIRKENNICEHEIRSHRGSGIDPRASDITMHIFVLIRNSGLGVSLHLVSEHKMPEMHQRMHAHMCNALYALDAHIRARKKRENRRVARGDEHARKIGTRMLLVLWSSAGVSVRFRNGNAALVGNLHNAALTGAKLSRATPCSL